MVSVAIVAMLRHDDAGGYAATIAPTPRFDTPSLVTRLTSGTERRRATL